jgi:hypothetical protein
LGVRDIGQRRLIAERVIAVGDRQSGGVLHPIDPAVGVIGGGST